MRDSNCIFCKIANGEIPSRTIEENDMFRVVLDVGPATRGHALILPKENYRNLYDLMHCKFSCFVSKRASLILSIEIKSLTILLEAGKSI